MSDNMIENVQRALGKELKTGMAPRALAIAAITAMRTPTEDMVRAGEAWRDHCGDADSMYEEMVSVALNGAKC